MKYLHLLGNFRLATYKCLPRYLGIYVTFSAYMYISRWFVIPISPTLTYAPR